MATDPLGPFYDCALQLELAEHAWLLRLGWKYGTAGDLFYWKAPPGHRCTYYETRGHAINSAKKRQLGPLSHYEPRQTRYEGDRDYSNSNED